MPNVCCAHLRTRWATVLSPVFTAFVRLRCCPTCTGPGNSLILKVAVVAVPEPKLHWEKDGNLIVGADGEVLVIDDISGADAGSYAAVISNSCLGDSAEQNQCVRRSDDAVVQINSPPRIIDQPVNITLDPGQRLRLVAAFAGLPFPELQWQKVHSDERGDLGS